MEEPIRDAVIIENPSQEQLSLEEINKSLSEELDAALSGLSRLRFRVANQKKALRAANRVIQEQQMRLSNQTWKIKMWEERCKERDQQLASLASKRINKKGFWSFLD